MATMKLYTDIDDPIERLAAIHRTSSLTKKSMEGLSKPVAQNLALLSMGPLLLQNMTGLGGRARPPFNLMISNVPGPVDTQYLAGAKLEMMAPIAVLYHGLGLMIAALTVSGTMGIGFIGDRDSLPHLQRLAVYVGNAFDELDKALPTEDNVHPSTSPMA